MRGRAILIGVIFFILGALVGAGGLYWYSDQQAKKYISQHQEEISQVPSPQNATPSGIQSPPSAINPNQNSTQNQNSLSQMLAQGITLNNTVASVYPNAGFVIEDNSGTQMFIQWNGSMPSVGQNVEVKGKLYNASRDLTQIQSLPGFTEQLQSFLQSQPIYMVATEVNQNAVTTTPPPVYQ